MEDNALPKMMQAELNEVIRKHVMFMTAKPGGARAVVRDKDLSGLSFLNQQLSQSDFSGCNFTEADLSNANFESATLFGCDFTDAKMDKTRMVRADLRGADMSNTDLTTADMTRADLREGKTLHKPKIKKELPPSALTLTGEPVEHFAEVEMTLDELLLKHIAWMASGGKQGSKLDLTGMDMRKGPSLAARKLTALQAPQAIFADMDMRGVEMQGARLEKADFSKCLLQNADMRGCDLSDAILQHANLSKATLTPLTFKKRDGMEYHIPCNFKKANLRHATLTGARIMTGIFKDADLTASDFTGCDLRKADFTGAILTDAKFDGAMLDGTVFDPKT